MRRRSRAGGKLGSKRRRKTVKTAECPNAPKPVLHSNSAAGEETEIARFTRELHVALEQAADCQLRGLAVPAVPQALPRERFSPMRKSRIGQSHRGRVQ